MNKYIEKDKKDINTLNIKDVNKDTLLSVFMEKQDATIYIEEDNQIIGIITLGNLRRHILKGEDLINRKFSCVMSGSREEIEKVFNISKNIMSVPLINEKGELVKEYCRVRNIIDNHPITDEMISEIYKESALICNKYSKVIFVVDRKYNDSNIYKEKEVLDARNTDELCKCLEKNNVLVVDLAYSSFYVRRIFYDKYNIKNIIRYDGSKNIFSTKHISERGKLFTNIAIDNTSVVKKNIFKEKNVVELDLNKCIWNPMEECYEYMERSDEEIEAVFALVCFSMKPWIIINEKYIPIIADIYVMGDKELILANMIDIFSNIIPKFDEKGIKSVFVKFPENEREIIKDYLSENIYARKRIGDCTEDELVYLWNFSDICTEDELIKFVSNNRIVIKNGFRNICDFSSKHFNVNNRERYTMGNPIDYKNIVFMFGPCIFSGGPFVTDENTIASYLRKKVSNRYYIKSMGHNFISQNFVMRTQSYNKGDLAIIMVDNDELFTKSGYKVHSIIEAYKKVDNLVEHVWDGLSHCDKEVTKNIADEIFSILKKEEVLSTDTSDMSDYPVLTFGVDDGKVDIPLEMQNWLNEVTKQKIPNVKNAGAIVMNCNPFTLGHRYLIETASSQVDVLYIFVLEEDKSFFKFNDRIELVRQGTKDLENVVVLPSGRYVISTETLPGYFDKEKNPYAELDATEDLEIFSQVIAKEFDIKVRFAGEEPNDPFTRKYNDYMRRLLPKNGVEFIEIPRKECGNQAISASLVRKHLKEKNFDEIEKLVPPTTLEYLKTNYM